MQHTLHGAMASPSLSKLMQTRSNRWYYFVFFLAGFPALTYQVAWQRVLALYFGVDIYSTTVTVASFLLGLGLGSLWGGRAADRSRHPAIAYAAAEFVIGCFGVLSVSLFSAVGEQFGGTSLGIVVLINFMLLLIPATLMGLTLPLMCRIVAVHSQSIGTQLSYLYGVNTLGAAVGAIATAYVLIGTLGIDGTTYFAGAINLTLALLALAIARSSAPNSRRASHADRPDTNNSVATSGDDDALDGRAYFILSFVSGFIGLGYEIVWYRVLGCLLHGTVYVFGTILGIYLLGIAAGSFVAQRHADRPGAVRRFGLCHLGIAGYTIAVFVLIGHFSWLPGLRHLIAASAYTTFHPAPELLAGHVNFATVYSVLDIPLWTLLLLGVPTFLMGYGFPNLLRAASRSVDRLGREVGGIYFANVLGSTSGTLSIGFVTIQYLGTEQTLLLLAMLGFVPSLLIVMHGRYFVRHKLHALTAVGLVIVPAVSCAVFPSRGDVIRAIHYADFPQVEIVAQHEDRSGIVLLKVQHDVVSFDAEKSFVGSYRLYIDGANHGGLPSLDEVAADEMVRLALVGNARPRRVLSIGLGNGNMCAAAAKWPHVDELVVVELNSALGSVLRHTANGRCVFESPKLKYVEDDGRRWMLANPAERFDVVMMFPLHAAHAHSGNLFSREFFEIVQRHLNPGGILFIRSVDCYSTAKTLADVFPHVLRAGGTAYLASETAFAFELDAINWSTAKLCDCLEADRATIVAETADAPINRDLRPNSEYYVTYAYRNWLSPRLTPAVYQSPNRERFCRLVRESKNRTAGTQRLSPPSPR
jgi:spermidine synthase